MIKAIKREDYYNNSCFCDGCGLILLYNDEDVCILGDENVKYIKFEDGAYFKTDYYGIDINHYT